MSICTDVCVTVIIRELNQQYRLIKLCPTLWRCQCCSQHCKKLWMVNCTKHSVCGSLQDTTEQSCARWMATSGIHHWKLNGQWVCVSLCRHTKSHIQYIIHIIHTHSDRRQGQKKVRNDHWAIGHTCSLHVALMVLFLLSKLCVFVYVWYSASSASVPSSHC